MAAPRLISVIVPTRDRPAMLRQALASIRALEGPDLAFEILVGDNGRTEETCAIAREFGAVYLPVETAGASAARNAGLNAATGEFIAFLDDDDAWLPENIRPQLALLDAHPEIEAVIGQVIYADPNLVPFGKPCPEDHPGDGDVLLRRMLSGWFPQIGTTLARTKVRELIGEFDLTLLGGQDLDWLLRIARRRTLVFHPVACLLFRGRAPGTYNRLNYRRIGYDRKVFLRHSVPEWRIWRTPVAFAKAYSSTLAHFYVYFADAAEANAIRGERAEALKAAFIAAGILPTRALRHMIRPSPLRHGVAIALGFRSARAAPSDPPAALR
jgi:glycosyltransferase involved in cell wall biosynthesis